MSFLVLCAYNLILLGGTAFLVWHGWSPWWFAFAALFFLTQKSKDSA